MSKHITIVGGNIAGLSAAYYLAEKGCPVTVYETKIWDKPCGGAITIEFARYLQQELDIKIKELDQPISRIRFIFLNGKYIETDGIFIIISRYRLQEQLIEKLRQKSNIEIVFKRISANDTGLFSPQTVLATGYSGFTKNIIGHEWKAREYARTLKYEGSNHTGQKKAPHLLYFDSRLKGYGWFFMGNDRSFNLGIGGLVEKKILHKKYREFINLLNDMLGYRLIPVSVPKMWKIPIIVDNWNTPADMVIRGGRLFNVFTGELLDGFLIAVKHQRIAYVGKDPDNAVENETRIIDAAGKTLIPGFIDGHTHVAWLFTPEEFLKIAYK
ncbi:MAG: NAD(P)-binding protein [Dissulfuribacterales bacterium]